MPFTLSHPAAVLPLRRTGLPFAALVCGSMAPDLHMAVPGVSDHATHAWSGLPGIDLVLGLALTAVWVLVLGPAARVAAPRAVRARLLPTPRYGPRTWGLAIPGVLFGGATHIGWDTFTHQEMWGGQHVPWLYEIHHGHPGYLLAQYGSSLVGLLVVGAWALLTLRRREPHHAAPARSATWARVALLLPLALATGLGALVCASMIARGWTSTDVVLASGIRTVLVVSCFGCGIGALAWRLLTLRRPT